MWVYDTPTFYKPELKSIVVLPFRNESTATGQNPGTIIVDKLVAALRANGTYTVYSRNELKTLMDDQDLQLALSGEADPSMDISKFTNINAQAILVGAVTTYAATSANRTEQQPVYAYTRKGKQYISHYIPKQFTRNEANVSLTATLINKRDPDNPYYNSPPITKQAFADGSPPQMDPYGCTAYASDLAVQDLVSRICIVRRQIKIKPKDTIMTATGFYDNRWDESKKFAVTDQKMFVVVALPQSCDRNGFSISIIRKDTRIDLVRESFTWKSGNRYIDYVFSPAEIASKGGGPGKYEVKFYSGPDLIFEHKFTITD